MRLTRVTTAPPALKMKSSSLIVFLVIFAFGFLMPWTVEGAPKQKGKPGACPFVRPVPCFVYEPPECQSDWQCPKRQKCCQGLCGIKCTDPVDTSKPVTPGKCPVVIGHCERPNPVNICQNDNHCLNGFKCCRGPCGNSCVLPLKDSSFPGQEH